MAQPVAFAKRAAAIATLTLGVLVGHAPPARGQGSLKLLELGAQYGAPERLSGSVSGVFSFGAPSRKYQFPTKAVEIRGRLGLGGFGVGIGARRLAYGPFGPGAMVTVTRTFSSPSYAKGRATYLGVEAGVQWMGRINLGVARQIDGPSDRRDTVLTWSVGVQIPYGFWRW